ncbi:hypothetical protein EJB05_28276, partial [Eragrostis curvula]
MHGVGRCLAAPAVEEVEARDGVVWEQDVEAERRSRELTSLGFSFSAAGLLFPYHISDFTLYRPLTFHDSARPDHDLRHHRLAADGNCAEEFLVSVDRNSRGQPDGVCQRLAYSSLNSNTWGQFCMGSSSIFLKLLSHLCNQKLTMVEVSEGSLLPCADSLKSSCVNLTSQDKDMEQTVLANARVFVTRGGGLM